MHRFSHGTMPLRNIFKVRPQPSVPGPPTHPSPALAGPSSLPTPFGVDTPPGPRPPLGQAPSWPCSLSELHLLLGLRCVDGLLHQPPSLHAPQ